MKLFSAWYHGKAIIKKCFLKVIYKNRLEIGSKTTWRRNFSIIIGKGGKVSIGNNCFFNNDCSLTSLKSIKIGKGTLFGENVKIYDHNHKFNNLSLPIKGQGYSISEISIGSHCWIGSNVTILKGVHIGDNCVVGAGCVINRNIANNTIVSRNSSNLDLIPLMPKNQQDGEIGKGC